MDDNGYAYPDPGARPRMIIVAIFSAICVLAFGLLLLGVVRPWLDDYLLALEKLAMHDPLAAKRGFLDLIALVVAFADSVAIGFGIWSIHEGWQMARAERWPPRGMKIRWRMKILDGKSARRRGKVLITLGLTVAILMPVLGWKVYRDMSTFLDAPRASARQVALVDHRLDVHRLLEPVELLEHEG